MNTAVATEVIPNVTEPFAGGFLAGRIRVGDQVFALVVAPKEGGEHDDVAWSGSTKSVDGATSFFDGRANTEAMAAAGSETAKWALGLTLGGFSDWYLPSRDELEILYRAFKPTKGENYCWRGDNPSSVPVGYAYSPDSPAQTRHKAFRAGKAEAFETTWYWSSTQCAGDAECAWVQIFDDGYQAYDRKSSDARARVVRRVAI
jgi:hypothetical protein